MLAKSPEKANARDPDSAWTPLHFASRQGKLEAVHVLVEKKAVVEARGPDSRTPLHLAAGWGTYEASRVTFEVHKVIVCYDTKKVRIVYHTTCVLKTNLHAVTSH